MKNILSSIIKFLTTFFICFSLLSIHVEKLPEGNYEVSYSSVQAEEEGGSGMMSMITMLVIGVVTWRLTDMCAKTAPDILIAAAAGAIFIAGEATAILGHSDESEEESENYSENSGGENENAQTDAFKSQKSQAESTKSTGETKLMLQAAAAVAFGIAAVTAFTSATLLEAEAVACMSATAASVVADAAAVTASGAASKASLNIESGLLGLEGLLGTTITACSGSATTCAGECVAAQGAAVTACVTIAGCAPAELYAAEVCRASVKLSGTNQPLVAAAKSSGVTFEKNSIVLESTEEALALQITAGDAAIAAETAIGKVQASLVATLPSKLISTTILAESGIYTASLEANSTAVTSAGLLVVEAPPAAGLAIAANSSVISLLLDANLLAFSGSLCSTSAACSSAIKTSEAAAGVLEGELLALKPLVARVTETATASIAAAKLANMTCATLTATLGTQIAMCEPGITSAFGSHKSPFQIGDAAKTCSIETKNNKPDQFIMDLLSAPSKTYKDIDKVALEKTRSANDPVELFNKVISIAMESILPSAKAGLMDMLGLAGPAIGIFAAMKTTTSYEWDNLLASPGNRAMIWTGLGVATAAATMQTNDQIAEKEEEIAELDQIIEKLEHLDKDAQDRDSVRDSKSGKNSANVRQLGGQFNSRKNGNPSVNDRLAGSGKSLEDNKFSQDGFPCVKTDKNGKCDKFAGNLSVTGDKGLDKISESVGGLADSLNGSTNLDGKSRLLSSSIVKGKSAVDKALDEKKKRYNLLRKKQGKKPIDFKRLGGEFFTKLRGQTAAAAKKQGFSGGQVANGFNSKAARDARAALLKAQRYKYKKRKAINYKSKGIGLNKAKRSNYGRQKGIAPYSGPDSLDASQDDASVQNNAAVRDRGLREISEDSGVSIFGIISNRYNVLKVRRRFGR